MSINHSNDTSEPSTAPLEQLLKPLPNLMATVSAQVRKTDAQPRQPRRNVSPSPMMFWMNEEGHNHDCISQALNEAAHPIDTEILLKDIQKVRRQRPHVIHVNAMSSPMVADRGPRKPLRQKSGTFFSGAASPPSCHESLSDAKKAYSSAKLSDEHRSLAAAVLLSFRRKQSLQQVGSS